MKVFGFYGDDDKAMLLKQVTLELDVDMLRKISNFFSKCANEIESDPEGWEHEHLCDFLESELEHDIVVFNSNKRY